MIYEMRRYECLPGKLADLNELMDKVAVPMFEKQGMTVVGAWKPVVGDDENTLVYMLAYEDMGARQKMWAAFYSDPEWQKGRAEITAKVGGPIVAKMTGVFLEPTSYSPLK